MTSAEELLWEMWEKCLLESRKAEYVPAEAVQCLIESSRMILTAARCSKRDADFVLYGFYTTIHWDWKRPTDRVFETLLEFELAEFFIERGLQA